MHVDSIRIHEVDSTTRLGNKQKLRLIVAVLDPNDVKSGNARDVLERLKITVAFIGRKVCQREFRFAAEVVIDLPKHVNFLRRRWWRGRRSERRRCAT